MKPTIIVLLGAAFLLCIGALLVSSHRYALAQQPTQTTLPDGSILVRSTRDSYLGVTDTFDFIPAGTPQTVERVGAVESRNGLSLQYADLGRPVLFGQIGGPFVYVFVRSPAGVWRQTELKEAHSPEVVAAGPSLRVWTSRYPDMTEWTEWYHVPSETGVFERFRSTEGWQQ